MPFNKFGKLGSGSGFSGNIWYVSETSGNDGNTGLSLAQAFKTLNALFSAPEFADNDRVILEDDSTWREELYPIGHTNITFERSNTGTNRPKIDGADIINNGNLVNDAVQTNTYTLAFTPQYGGGADDSRISIFEDNDGLIRVADAATCNSTPGSFFAAFPDSGVEQTIYIHPKGSTVPGSKVFEITSRLYAVRLTDGCVLDGVEAQRAGSNNGSIYSFSNTFVTIRNCIMRWGTKHHCVVAGCLMEDCQAIDVVPGNPDCIPFTAFDGTGTQRVATFRRCTATVQQGIATGAAWYAHGAGSGFVRGMVLEDCEAVNTTNGFSELAGMFVKFIRCIYRGSGNAFSLNNKGIDSEVIECQSYGASNFINTGSNIDSLLKVHGNRHYSTISGHFMLGTFNNVDVRWNSVFAVGVEFRQVSSILTPDSVIIKNNIFQKDVGGATGNVFHRYTDGSETFDTYDVENNMVRLRFGVSAPPKYNTGQNLATLQSEGLEIGSNEVTIPGFVDPANGNFATTAPEVDTLQAGWEYYVAS